MSINLERKKIQEALIPKKSTIKAHLFTSYGLGRGRNDGAYTPAGEDEYADIGLFTEYCACTGVSTGGAYLKIRGGTTPYSGLLGGYWVDVAVVRATADVRLYKGIDTVIGTEAVDLTAESTQYILLQATGTTIKVARAPSNMWYQDPDVAVPSDDFKITVTDSTYTSGLIGISSTQNRYTPPEYWGAVSYFMNSWTSLQTALIRPSSSPSEEPVAYFEVPVVGTGKLPLDQHGLPRAIGLEEELDNPGLVDPYRVELPQEIVEKSVKIPKVVQNKVDILRKKDWSEEEIRAFLPEAFPIERVNRLALNNSALIPTDNGKPKEYVAVVRVWPNSDVERRPIEKRVQMLKAMKGVRKLTSEEAIDLALQKDDKLHIHDLMPCKTHDLGGKCYKEYKEWRIGSVSEKPDFADVDKRKVYVKETKGW